MKDGFTELEAYCNNSDISLLEGQLAAAKAEIVELHRCLDFADEWLTATDADYAESYFCKDVAKTLAKHKGELVIPWEWMPDVVASIEVKSNGRILGHSKNESSLAIEFTTALKLDLTDIELPVTVHRPQR